MDWVVDTDVLVRAEQLDDRHDHWVNVMQLLTRMNNLTHSLVVDYDDKISSEYRSNLSATGWVYKLLARFVLRGHVRYVSGRLSNRINRGLRSLGFHDDDDVFVAVASRTSSGLLVAEESDYSQPVVDFLVGHRIRVVDCISASAEVDRLPP